DLQERGETGVVVLQRVADMALVEQAGGFVADRLPVVAQGVDGGESLAVRERAGRYRGKRIHQQVVRREHLAWLASCRPSFRRTRERKCTMVALSRNSTIRPSRTRRRISSADMVGMAWDCGDFSAGAAPGP